MGQEHVQMGYICFGSGNTRIPVSEENIRDLFDAMVMAVEKDAPLDNPQQYIHADDVTLFQSMFQQARKIPNDEVWVRYGLEGSDEPAMIKARENCGASFVICKFFKDY
jgi:hypothetical protein